MSCEAKMHSIKRYFQSWIDQNREAYDEIFDEDIFYSECYGPEYHGLTQVKRWFDDWNRTGKVMEWTIHNTITQGSTAVAEWYFRYMQNGQTLDFNGCSIIEFTPMGKIVSIKEFESKAEHCCPYGRYENEISEKPLV